MSAYHLDDADSDKEVYFNENVVLNRSMEFTLPVLSPNLPAPPCAEMILHHTQLAQHSQIPVQTPSTLEQLTTHIEAGNTEEQSDVQLPHLPTRKRSCEESWDIIDDPGNVHVLTGKWVYRNKLGPDINIIRRKSRWLARGYEQEYGIDYTETFASVVRQKTYRTLFALAAIYDWDIDQVDIKTPFLYGGIDGDVYMHLPPGFQEYGRMCKLKKALYGLKQSPRICYNILAEYLISMRWKRSKVDEALFFKDGIILAIYVDDILIFGKDSTGIADIKKELAKQFQLTDMGP